jgi:hypothetical protein
MSQTSKRPRINAEEIQLSFDISWKRKLDDPIICLTVGKPFLEELNEENDILIGTSNGRILILNEEKVNDKKFYDNERSVMLTSFCVGVIGRYCIRYEKWLYTIDCII